MKRILLLTLIAILGMCYNGYSQTSLSIGDIAFTGYWSFDGTNNKNDFSFIILKSGGITSGTTIYFTDQGYNGSNFSATAEGTVTWTSGSSLAQFSEVTVDIADAGTSGSASNGSVGVSGTFILSAGGDQIFAFNSATFNTANLLTGIHANVENGSFVTDPTNWDLISSSGIGGCGTCLTITSSRSTKPSVLTSGTDAIFLAGGTSTPYTEYDNGEYNCTGASASSLSALRSAINDPANWTLSNSNTLTLPSSCSFSVTSSTTWNGTTWSAGAPSSTIDAIIASSTTPGSFTCKALTINSGVALTINSGATATINGNVTNNGNGFSGTGTFTFASSGSLSGNAISVAGTVTVSTGATLTTGGLLTLSSDATNTGRIGNSAGSISGNIIQQRYIPGGRRAYRFFAHPFTSSQALSILTDDIDITGSGGASNGFTTTGTNNPSAFWYDVSTANGSTTNDIGWTAFTSASSSSWDQYEGIRVLVRGAIGQGLTSGTYTPSAVTLDMTGAVNQGTQSIGVTKGSGTTYALVGNPFASPVNMDAVSKTAGIGSNFYIWSAQQGTKGGYTTYSYGSSSFNLPTCGAFVTQISSNGTITIEEADKASGVSTMFKTTSFPNRVTLTIEDSTTYWDRLQLHYDDNAMAVSETDDAQKFPNPEVSFNTYSKDDSALSIDNRPYVENETILLGFTTPYQKNYKVVATDFDVPAGTKLYLKDNYTGKNEEITVGYEYWFSVDTNAASQGKSRFELNTQGQPTNSIVNNKSQQLKVKLAPNPTTGDVTLYYEDANEALKVVVTNMVGMIVSEVKANNINGNVVIRMHNMPAGIYMVNVRKGNHVTTHKLIKQ